MKGDADVLVTGRDKEARPAPAEPYAPSEPERRALTKLGLRMAKRLAVPRVQLGKQEGNAAEIEIVHNDKDTAEALLMESFGTASLDFLNGAMVDAVNISRPADRDPKEGFNYAMSIIQGVKPRDEIEALLGVQMAAVHVATMTAARKLNFASTVEQVERNERMLNRLSRTFTTQIEALKRYRSKGEQRVYVERVNVNEGGQAVIGNVSKGEG